MPEHRLSLARKGYEGYVYEPPRDVNWYTLVVGTGDAPVRAQWDQSTQSWNVIEGEPFDTNSDPGDESPWAV